MSAAVTGTRPAPRHARRRATTAVTVAALVAAACLGLAVPTAPALVLLVVVVVVSLPVLNAPPVVVIGLAVAFPWISRLLSTAIPGGRLLDFLDFPLVLLALAISLSAANRAGNRPDVVRQMLGRRLAYCAAAIFASWLLRDVTQPQRLVGGLLLALEPFLLLLAVLVAPLTHRDRRSLVGLLVVLLCGQLPFSLAAVLSGHVSDDVKGTLLGTGAGHHVSVGGTAVGFFVLAALRVRKPVLALVGACALFVAVVADAKQVLFVLPLGLLVLGISSRRDNTSFAAARGLVLGGVMAVVATYTLMAYSGTSIAVDFVERATTNRTGKVAVAQAMWDDLRVSPTVLAFGMGPGESVSRFAFLTTPALSKPGSPVRALGLEPSRNAGRYDQIAFSGPFTGNSSFTSAQSSALGLLGDYGLVGLAAFLSMIVGVISALRRRTDDPLRSAALAAWTLLLPLAVVFDWLEQPPFTLAVMLVTGLALRSGTGPNGRPVPANIPLPRVEHSVHPRGGPSPTS